MLLRVSAILLFTVLNLQAFADAELTTVFRNVRVLPMTGTGALENATVTVTGANIVSVVEGAGDTPGVANSQSGSG